MPCDWRVSSHESLPKGGIGRSSNGNVVLTDFALFIAPPAAESDESPVAESSDGDAEAEADEGTSPLQTQPEAEGTDAEAGSTPDTDVDTEAQVENTPDADTEAQAEKETADADADAQAESTPTDDTDAETQAESTPTNGASAENETEDTEVADPWTPVQIVQAWADHEQVMGEDNLGGVIANALDDKPETGWALDRRNENRQAIFLVAAPFGMEGGRLKIRLKHEFDLRQKQLGRFRLALTDAATVTRSVPR